MTDLILGLILISFLLFGFFFILNIKKKSIKINMFFYLVWFLVFISIYIATDKKTFFNENIISAFALMFFVWLTLLPTIMYAIVFYVIKQKQLSFNHFYIPICLFLVNFLSLLFFSFSKDSKSFSYEFIQNIMTYSNFLVIFFIFPISTFFYVYKASAMVIAVNKSKSIISLVKQPIFLFITLYFLFILSCFLNYIFPSFVFKIFIFIYLPVSAFTLFKTINKNNILQSSNEFSTSLLIIDDNLVKALNDNLVFLNPDLNIKQLARDIGTNEKYLSQLINKKYKTSYSNFINEFRVNYAKKLLLDVEYENYTLQTIGSMSGFKSKSSFNLTFKKISGFTPTDFKLRKGAV